MNLRLLPLAIAASALAGCASRSSMDATYDASLQHWRGVSRAELVAGWGKPLLQTTVDGVETLTYVVRNDMVNPGSLPVYSSNNVGSIAGGGGATGAPTVSAATVAPVVPMRCTTRFELRNGVVTSWTFDGLLCGAPT